MYNFQRIFVFLIPWDGKWGEKKNIKEAGMNNDMEMDSDFQAFKRIEVFEMELLLIFEC